MTEKGGDCMPKKNPKDMKSEIDSVVDPIEKKLVSSPDIKMEGAEKDLKPEEFTEGTDAMADGTAKANPEVSQKSRPHSKEIPIDEKELRENKQKNA